MDIYLSVNNRAEIMKLPVLPSEYTIKKPQGGAAVETVTGTELNLIGVPKLKSISISSFFPIRDYPYLRDTSMKGWDYIYKIDTWILQKLPIRLIITGTPINMPVRVTNFEYTIKTDGDLWYTLDLEEFNLVGWNNTQPSEENEEELTMSQYEELKGSLDYISGVLSVLANPTVYNSIDENMPDWAQNSVRKAMNKGILGGTDSGLGLKYEDLRVLVWLDRLGLLD